MAYTQSTASSLDDVISQLVSFAVTNAGFTNEGNVFHSGYTHYRLSKGGIYWTFRKNNPGGGKNHILVRMSYSISAVAAPTSANGQWDNSVVSTWNYTGPFPTIYMFTDGNCVHCVIEVTTGVFAHLSFGNIIKTDTFTGGEYTAGQFYDRQYNSGGLYYYYFDDSYGTPLFPGGYNTHSDTSSLCYLRSVPVSGQTNNEADWAVFGHTRNNNVVVSVAINSAQDYLMRDSPNQATMRSILLPVLVHVRDPVTGLYRSTGYIENIRLVNMEYLDPAEIILTNWQVFPFCAKEGTGINNPVTTTWGWAYKRA